MFEQAVFDVQSYDITLNVDPKTKSISGTTVMTAKTVIPTNVIVLDLDTLYTISKLTDGASDLKYQRNEGRIWIWFPMTKQVGEEIKTSITYAGTPRIAPNPPWIGGFMWKKTADGSDFISVALQNDGADLLFPCKDHPSDKPATSAMHITVPDPLIATGPGKLESVKKNGGTSTYNWRMTNPIANYSLVFNAAPYKLIEDKYKSVSGDMLQIVFYVLPESYAKAPGLIAQQKKYLAFFEKYLGPFPFRSQKVGIVETPHLGMEHSTNIAYGNKFQYDKDGTDWLLLHEFGHEWWANLVTASDWRDFWIHEGFQSYMDTLYQEHLHGKEAYLKSMAKSAKSFRNMQPVAPREAKDRLSGLYDRTRLPKKRRRHLRQRRLHPAHAAISDRRRRFFQGAASHGVPDETNGNLHRRPSGEACQHRRFPHHRRSRFRHGTRLVLRALFTTAKTPKTRESR